jgi:hypothetical protein
LYIFKAKTDQTPFRAGRQSGQSIIFFLLSFFFLLKKRKRFIRQEGEQPTSYQKKPPL